MNELLVKEFPKPVDGVIYVFNSDSLQKACDILQKYKIHSLPVCDSSNPGFVVGMLDVLDIVCFIASKSEGPVKKVNPATLQKAVVSEVADFSGRSPYLPVPETTPMSEVIRLFIECNLHRVLVHDENNKLSNVITQTAIINILSRHISELGAVANKTISELNLGSAPVFTVDISLPTIEAFKTMRDKQSYGIAVVNNNIGSTLVAVLSAKDARFICHDFTRVKYLGQPLSHLLGPLKSSDNPLEETRNPSITIRGSDTLHTLLEKFSASKVHRVYTVSDTGKPLTVITLTDLLRAISSN